MAPRSGQCVKIVSPHSGSVTVLSRSVSAASSVGHVNSHNTSRHTRRALSVLDDNVPRQGNKAEAEQPHVQQDKGSHRAKCGRRPATAPVDLFLSRPAPLVPSRSASATHHSITTTTKERKERSMSHSVNNNSSRCCVSLKKQQQEEVEGDVRENKEAVARAAAELRQAASRVLRHNNHNNNSNSTAITVKQRAQKEESMPLVGCETAPKSRALQLPRTIPLATRRSRDEEGEEDDEDAVGVKGGEDTTLFLRRRSKPRPEADRAMQRVCTSAGPHVGQEGSAAHAPALCPGMFQGLSAIELEEQLFDGLPGLSGELTSCQGFTAQLTPTSSLVRSQPPYHSALTEEQASRSNTNNSNISMKGTTVVRTRCCACPLWSLIGTFRAPLSSVVDVDAQHDTMRWTQRNPRGGYQLIRLPLHSITDVTLVRLVQEDAAVQACQYTLLLRSSTRPSQVVFGFRTQKEANQLRSFVQLHVNLK